MVKQATTKVVMDARRPSVAGADYMELVREFPIRQIRNKSEYAMATSILDNWIGREGLTEGQRDYLAALVRFVEDYERENLVNRMKRLTPIELLKHLMEENDMSTADLGYVVGSRGLASEVLNGKRGLSKRIIAKLAGKFAVDPGLFLDKASPK